MQLKENSLIVFQGDSITDAGREREKDTFMGAGYVFMLSALLAARYPGKNPRFINRGLGGDTVQALYERWEQDCLVYKPDVVSILIGINDTWRRFSENREPDLGRFEAMYREMLTGTQERSGAQLVIIEPFLLTNRENYKEWRMDLDARIDIIRGLAAEFHTCYVPMDGIMAQACTKADASYWSTDGVHLTPAGHALLAQSWLASAGL
jgi:lysophospholipase L1-like esterase